MSPTTQTHTPTPWTMMDFDHGTAIIYDKEQTVVIPKLTNKANAAFIVRAVNAHEEMLSALKEMRTRYARLEGLYAEKAGITYDCPNGTIKLANRAIAKAEGRS